MTEPVETKPRTRRCPICGKATAEAYRPFCSRRCADIDLARWLGGGYVIAGSPDEAREEPDERTPDPASEQSPPARSKRS